MEQHLRSQLEDLYPTALRMAMYHLGRREELYLFEQPTLLLVKTHGLGPAVPHFLTQKSFTEGLWLGLAFLWWSVNLLEDPNDDSDDTHMDGDASRCPCPRVESSPPTRRSEGRGFLAYRGEYSLGPPCLGGVC